LSTSAVQENISQPPKNKHKVIAWLPTIVWLVMIGFFSTDTFSAHHTGSILLKIIRAVYGDISDERFQLIHVAVRKTAHFTVYGLLSGLAFYSWRVTFPRRIGWAFSWSGLALLLTLVAASLDEFHQIFVPSRGPSPYDVMLDMMGATFVQMLIAAFARFRA
jgi:VanZ family protein